MTDGGTNAVAVVSMQPSGSGEVTGLIPTGWYPNSVSVSADGKTLFVARASQDESEAMPGLHDP